MPRLKYTYRATRELDGIWDYSAERWGADQAQKYLAELRAACRTLVSHPFVGVDCAHLRPGFRQLTYGSHYVFYRVQPNGDIEIMRIIHQSRDLRRAMR